MMRKANGWILVLVVGIAGAAQQGATEKEKTPDYYPLKPGTKWLYEMNANGQKVKVLNQVALIETLDGKSLAKIETVVNGEVTGTEHVAATDKGVFRYRVKGVELPSPICLLKYPFKKNETWEMEATIGSEKLTVKGRAVDREELTVGAGKYQTLKVEVNTTVIGQQIISTYWFAPEVGIVKHTMVEAGKDVTWELAKFETPK
jgi:hypothetical protein